MQTCLSATESHPLNSGFLVTLFRHHLTRQKLEDPLTTHTTYQRAYSLLLDDVCLSFFVIFEALIKNIRIYVIFLYKNFVK